MGVIVRTKPSIDDVNMLVLAEFLFDLRPFEQYVLPLAPPLLILGKADAVHCELGMKLFGRLYFHERLLVRA